MNQLLPVRPVIGPTWPTRAYGMPEPAIFKVAEPEVGYSSPSARPLVWSEASLDLLEALEAPLEDREPKGYNRELVDDYRPNRSSLLPVALADQLYEACRWCETLPLGAFARAVQEPFVLDLAHASSRLEGNALDRRRTQGIFSLGLLMHGGAAHGAEIQMPLNHKDAIEYMVDAAPNQKLCIELLFAVHARLMSGLMEDRRDLGRIRTHGVEIGSSTFTPEQNSEVLWRMLHSIVWKANAIRNPVEAAFFLWVHIAYLQPFADGNKRVSRLAANVPLVLRNCAPLSFDGVSERDYRRAMLGVYERNDFSVAIDVFAHVYRCSTEKYIAMLPRRPRLDPRIEHFQHHLPRVVSAVVEGRLSAIAAISLEQLNPKETADLGLLVNERLKTLEARHSSRFDIDEARIDAWIAAGRPH